VVPGQLLAALQAAGARAAVAGEFTRRAVFHGKMDLLQAEAVGDLIDAAATAQAGAALRQLEGGLSRRIAELRRGLIDLQALLSYEVDFPEEDDPPVPRARLRAGMEDVAGRIDLLLATAPAGERLREGALLVLAGAPNVGKSSLFNALLGNDRALVTDIPGTTRDAIEAHTEFLGWPVRLVDTAGVGATTDRIDRMGMEVSRRWAGAADLVLHCVAADRQDSVATAEAETLAVPGSRRLLVRTKSDLGRPDGSGIAVSVITGEGLERLRQAAANRIFGERMSLGDLEPALTRARHRQALSRAATSLAEARPHLSERGDTVLASHHVREATAALDELIGVVDIEQVLDRVFSSFCVGK
jgi:tRNA modification GTPase